MTAHEKEKSDYPRKAGARLKEITSAQREESMRKHTVSPVGWFFLGVAAVVLLLFLTGAVGPAATGRYQVSAWGGSGIGFGAFVTDTASGRTKLVYLNLGMDTSQRNNLGKSFEDIP